MTRRTALLAVLCWLIPALSLAAALPENMLVQSHRGYIWRVDGSSATQGSGSIANYPTKTTGTVSYTLSQVTESPLGTMPPGSGTLIKAVVIGGASGGNITINFKAPGITMAAIGNFGMFWYEVEGGNGNHGGPSFYLGDSTGMTNSLRPNGNATTTNIQRKAGWNFFNYQRGDTLTTTGSFSYDSTTITDGWILIPMVANKTTTFYFGDWLYGYYTKPQLTIWSADNGRDVIDTMYPYMSARNIPGAYVPWAQSLLTPTGSQITSAELLTMHNNGWSVHNHGYDPAGAAYNTLSIDAVRADMLAGKNTLSSLGFRFSPFFYPNGGEPNHSAALDALYAEFGYTHGNNTNTGAVGDQVPRYQYGGLKNPYNMWSVTVDNMTGAQVIVVINNLVKYGGNLSLLIHEFNATMTATQFKLFIDYAYRLREANVIDIVSWDDLVKRQTNPRMKR